MKLAYIAVILLLIASAVLLWRYYSRESRFKEAVQEQGIDSNIDEQINSVVEEEVNKAVENISEADIETALLG